MSRSADKLHARSIIASVFVPQYRFVNRSGGLGGPGVLGVSENAARPGRSVSAVTGYSAIVEAAVPINIGDVIDSDAEGRAVVAASGGYGTAESACPAGGLFELRCAFVGGGGIGGGAGGGLVTAATLRQEPNKGWPAERPDYAGPLILIGWDDPPAWPGAQYDQYISIPRIYVPIVQDFSTIYPGPVPAEEFAQYWAAAYISCDIVEIDLPTTRRALRFVGPNSSARSMLIWERSGVESDQDALARVVNPIPANLNANAAGLVVRANKIGTSRAGYLLNIRSTSPAEITLTKFESNASTTLRTQALSSGLSNALKAAGAVVMMRLRAVGDSITGSIWLDGADESEAVVIAATDSGVVSGQVAVTSATPNYEGVIDYISVAYGGDVAPLPGV